MATDVCTLMGIAFDCFQLDKAAPKFFGFAELLSGLALTLLVWTIADVRYKFRIETAGFRVRDTSIAIVLALGVVILITDLWRYSQWWLPQKGPITPEIWQFILGLVFFAVFSTWLIVAFLSPPVFNRRNASQFCKSVESRLERGAASELTIVAAELTRSSSSIISHAAERAVKSNLETTACARELLKTIASPRFCRVFVESAPKLIISLFNEIRIQEAYGPEAENLARNVLTAAINNRDSFLFVELQHEELGLKDYPVIRALCGDLTMVNGISMLLSPYTSRKTPWDLEQWRAYLHLVLEAFATYVKGPCTTNPNSLHWAYQKIRAIYADLNADLSVQELRPDEDLYQRLKALGELIENMVELLDKHKAPAPLPHTTIAKIILDLIEAASCVRKPRHVARKIQATLVWEDILNSCALRSDAGTAIQIIVHEQLLNTIKQCPDLDSVRLLGYCLNVLGFVVSKEDSGYGSTWRTLHVEFLQWVKANLAGMLKRYPRMASECFVEGMSFDAQHNRLVIRYPTDWGDIPPEYFELDPAPSETQTVVS
ncbi:hypothetical protein PRtIB026_A36870 [Pseudomonas sp. RtIB026]|uniref:hypothetical protein n=1 Tax=Pseudomonas sp. RtIB026 TaxID=2749999 RepID=UPI0019433DA4|nr:hypothetical protein [Pseudomonas sp. RtIB026]BCJ06552.1 hypothetical protein PRtIB026_A36870 [Pseudomonas sp. RtIB026]